MPARPLSSLAALALPALLLAACDNKANEGSTGAVQDIPENSGMSVGTGVGDNAPGASDAPAVQSGSEPTGSAAGAMNQPATGSP